MKLAEIAGHRLISQQLTGSPLKTAPEMVKWFGAVQGQEYAQTKWGLGLRLPHLTDGDIEKDLTEGRILRTHILRPTWHFVSAEDIRWILMLTSPRVHAANAYMYRKLELQSKVFSRCHVIFARALEGEKQLTRDDLNLELNRNKIKAEGLRLGYIMMHAELEGLICSGPRKGNQFTYMMLEERVPSAGSKTREQALHDLIFRYFSSRGPATLQDFSTWSGLTIAECKKGIDSQKSALARIEIEDATYFFFEAIPRPAKTTGQVRFLPIYDEYIMGYKNRKAIFLAFKDLRPKPVLPFDSTIILDGQVVGTWKRTIKPKSVQLEYELFVPFNKKQQAELEKTISRFKEFTGK